jgi:phospholipid/cholesterol/gamma-HCH transport system substrate-binding protein
VRSSSAVFRAFASESGNLSAGVGELPAALRQTTDTLGRVQALADELGPAAQALRPAARALAPANAAVRPLAREGTPLLAHDIRPFVRESRPLVRSLRPATRNLSAAAPDLGSSLGRVNHFFNLLAFNPKGREGPDVPGRQEGYLFFAAWLQHEADSLFATADANGVLRPVTYASPCGTIAQELQNAPQLEFLQMLTPILVDTGACGSK